MDLKKIGTYIKKKRLEQGYTQQELADKLYVTEKAISRWETGRGTPDISLLEPLANILNVSISDILNGGDKVSKKNETSKLIEFVIEVNNHKYNRLSFAISMFLVIMSFGIFLSYLKYEYSNIGNANYFVSLGLIVLSSFFLIMGIGNFNRNYIDKITDRKKLVRVGKFIVFLYYIVLLFNVVIYSRVGTYYGYNFIPLATIVEVLLGNYTIYYKVINLLGNALFFVPLGYFFVDLFNIASIYRYFLLVFLFILSVEVLQIVLRCGVFDVDDIILNVASLLIVYFIEKKISFRGN